MKRDLSKLKKRDIIGIKKWLRSKYKSSFCPFGCGGTICVHHEKCEAVFPSLEGLDALCPCHIFNCSYVTKVAKQVVKEWEGRWNTE